MIDESRLTAFGGGPLLGTRIVRVIYLDETGHDARNQFCAVAGMLVDPDNQWAPLAEEVANLREEVPEEFRPGFLFHASELFHRGGKYRERWPVEDRRDLLKRLVALPRKLSIPMVLGFAQKPTARDEDRHRESLVSHSMAYMFCLKAADAFMIRYGGEAEGVMIVAEERPEAQKVLRAAHNLSRSGELVKQWLPPFMHDRFPLSRIKAAPAFASKDDEVILQISDAFAFVMQRALNGAADFEEFIHAIFGGDGLDGAIEKARRDYANYIFFHWPTTPPDEDYWFEIR